ncbi:MAG: hypothetical protein IPL54_07090 [Chitinophagaceae bacterium]|nr:hypothetical protein [Chitinophagaceae bacterium]
MKNYAFFAVFVLLLLSVGCKSKIDGTALADEVCECRMKTKGMKFDDPERKRIWKECSKIQGDNWMKIVKDKPAEDAFNKRLNECLQEVINGK